MADVTARMAQISNPGTRPRRGIAAVLVAGAVVGVTSLVAVVGGPTPAAEASGLETFSSCAELSSWGDAAMRRTYGEGDVLMSDTAADGSPATTVASADDAAAPTATANESASGADRSSTALAEGSKAAADEDGTNVVVEGVDELDLVDRLAPDVVLVSSSARLAVVDLAAGKVVAVRDVPWDAQVTYDGDAGVAWVVGQSEAGEGVQVERVAVDTGGFGTVDRWTTPGFLVDARRVGGELTVVASDGFQGIATDTVPFEGGPVPCDQVLHPVGPSDPSATLLATLPAEGALQPLRATEVVGSGQLVAVTTGAAYLATPQWDAEVTTTIHRFDLASLTHTGSGRVPGTLLDDFSMSEHDGHLRVAVTAGGGGRFGGPFPIEPGMGGDVIVDDMPMGTIAPRTTIVEEPSGAKPPQPSSGTSSSGTATGAAEPATDPAAPPDTTIPGTETTVPETTVPESTTAVPEETTTTVPETTTTVAETTTTTTVPETTTTTTAPQGPVLPGPKPGEPLNAVVVLDTEGDLDTVGNTPWFGHEGETLQGIRFDGDVGYAVTFLQTDPFYVLDLADPTAPEVAGEVELPGFSAYLHPLGGGRVVGFGPGEDGSASAKLFDVSDPSAPKVIDTIRLGDESAVTYDHHAFVDLGDGRFAVPASAYRETFPERCTTSIQEDAQARQRELESQLAGRDGTYAIPEDQASAVYEEMDALNAEGCLYPGSTTDSSVVVLALEGGRLVEQDRQTAELTEGVTRALPSSEGWALLGGTTIVLLDDAGTVRTTLSLG